jgi:hypothetical protein
MSDAWQGPGWWMASDGKWYPPELHPYIPWPAPAPAPGPWPAPAPGPNAWPAPAPAPAPRPPGLARRGIITLALTLVVVALGTTLVAVSSKSNPSPGSVKIHGTAPVYIAPLTGFAGYHWLGDVQQISAQWRVPAITASSPVGHASTWIGAQGNGQNSPFIQVGVTEDKFGPGDSVYELFWSDTAASFHPQPLGPVGPGDLLSVSMTRQSGGWSLAVDDRTDNTPVTKLVGYGVGASFMAAEWIQEDPTDSSEAAVDLPYPQTSTVSFQRVVVNGEPPTLDRDDGQVLIAADGTILVPGPVRQDAFVLGPPTGAAARYLHAAAGLDAAVSAYNVEISSWDSIPMATRLLDVQHLSAAFQTNATALAAQQWPPASSADVSLLIDRLHRLVSDLQAWTAAGLETQGNAYQTFSSDQEIGPLADNVRADLGLPPG